MFFTIVLFLHGWNLFLVLASGLITGIWGLILFFTKRTQTMSKPWRNALIVTALLALLQGVLGVLLVVMGGKPGVPGDSLYYLHYVYGAIVAFAIPVGVTYATGGKNIRRDVLILSLAALVLFAAGFRGWMTGPPTWPWIP
jgi:heme A synthase